MSGTQLLNTGVTAGDKTGDSPRVGAIKINLNTLFSPMGGDTINAGYFAFNPDTGVSLGRTAVQIVQAGIDYCVANGYGALWIPKKVGATTLLPYDASLVTFNNAVHMTREGGSGRLDEWDIRAYGADPIGTLDSYYAETAAIAGAAASGLGGTVLYPDGSSYKASRPVRVSAKSIRLTGEGVPAAFNQSNSGAILTYNYYGGPRIATNDYTIPTTASLISGSGAALDWSGNTGSTFHWINLRESATCDLNGLSALAVDFWMQLTAAMPDNFVVNSYGRWLANSAFTSAFGMRGITPNFTATITTTTTTYSLAMTTPVDGAVHYYRLRWDGSTFRWDLDGTTQASTATTGTLVQGAAEEVWVGPITTFSPGDKDNFFSSFRGYIDGLRISNTDRGATVPTSKPSVDANTLILLNNATTDGPLLKAQTKSGDVWLYVHKTGAPTLQATGFEVSRLTIHDGGRSRTGIQLGPNTNDPFLDRINVADCRNGIMCDHDNFFFRANDIYITENAAGGARYGMYVGMFGGLGRIQGLRVFGYAVPLVCHGGTLVIDDLFCNMTTTTVYGTLLQGSDVHQAYTFNGPNWNAEQAGTNLLSELACTSVGSDQELVVTGGTFESQSAAQHITIDGWGAAQFNARGFKALTSNPTTVIKFGTGGIVTPALFARPPKFSPFSNTVPLSDVAGRAIMGPIGKGTALAFSASLTLDASLRDEFEIGTLTGNVTLNLTNVTPGQNLKVWTKQDATGGRTITLQKDGAAGNVKNATAATTAANQTNAWAFDAMLDGTVNQLSFTTGT